MTTRDLDKMAGRVSEMERLAHKLMDEAGDMPVVEKSLKRIMSSVDILKQNLNDLAPLMGENNE